MHAKLNLICFLFSMDNYYFSFQTRENGQLEIPRSLVAVIQSKSHAPLFSAAVPVWRLPQKYEYY